MALSGYQMVRIYYCIDINSKILDMECFSIYNFDLKKQRSLFHIAGSKNSIVIITQTEGARNPRTHVLALVFADLELINRVKAEKYAKDTRSLHEDIKSRRKNARRDMQQKEIQTQLDQAAKLVKEKQLQLEGKGTSLDFYRTHIQSISSYKNSESELMLFTSFSSVHYVGGILFSINPMNPEEIQQVKLLKFPNRSYISTSTHTDCYAYQAKQYCLFSSLALKDKLADYILFENKFDSSLGRNTITPVRTGRHHLDPKTITLFDQKILGTVSLGPEDIVRILVSDLSTFGFAISREHGVYGMVGSSDNDK